MISKPAAEGRGSIAVHQRAGGARRRAAGRRRSRLLAASSILAVVAIVAVLVIAKLAGGGSSAAAREAAPAAAVQKVTTIPLSTLVSAASRLQGLAPAKALTDPALTSGGKPEFLYIGAEYCPVCAAERWPMVIALSHFGTFSNLSQTRSAKRDGDIATFSFFGSTYSSKYLKFTPVETTTNEPSGNYYKKLETPTDAQMALWQSKEGQNLGFPFLDIGGKWMLTTSQYPLSMLEGRSFNSIVDAVGANDNSLGAAIDASAAVMTKYICSVTGQQPADTCRAVAGVATPTATGG